MPSTPLNEDPSILVQIVGPTDDWILEKLARKLASKLPYAKFVPWKPESIPSSKIVYYINYALFKQPSNLIDVGFFTHDDSSHRFLEIARQVDFCVSMSQKYADWLKSQRIQKVVHIPMGFDSVRFRPRLVLGIVGRLEHPRKGKELVEKIRALPFVEIASSEGKIAEKELREFYQRIDYVLIPAIVEGGPMCLLEGLSMGKPIIAPEGVGMVQEFEATQHIHRYPAGDFDALVQLLHKCFEEKVALTSLVANRSWDHWAESHHHVFMRLLKEHGHPLPQIGPHFRFGLIRELDLPWDIDLEPLENSLDKVASHLFYGRELMARTALMEIVSRFPCAEKLLETLTSKDTRSPASAWSSTLPLGKPTMTNPVQTLKSNIQATDESFPKILLIAHFATLRDRMDKSHYYRYEALSRKSGVTLFGQGIPGYQSGMSLDDAIEVCCGGNIPDVILHGADLRDSGIPLVQGLDRTKIPTAIELLDTWAFPDRTVDFIQRQGFKVGLIQEAGPHLEFYRRHCPKTQFFWTPNAVNTQLFRDYELPKEYDVILYGVLEDNIYPFRTRLTNLLINTPDLKVKHIAHPGYYPRLERETHPVISGAELSRAINQAWIGIATRSRYNCLLMKYLEIAASSTVVAGNLPEWGHAVFANCFIELNEQQSDDAILFTIRNHLTDKNKLLSVARTARQRVVRELSTEAFANLVIGIFQEILRDSRKIS